MLSALRLTPTLKDHVPVFVSPSDRVAQLYPHTPGSLFVAFHDSQGYGGGILTRLHKGRRRDKETNMKSEKRHKNRSFLGYLSALLNALGVGCIEKPISRRYHHILLGSYAK
jgi:hypothetical protein